MEYPISFFFVIYHYFCSLKSKILLPNDKKIAIENFCEMVEKLKEIRIEDYTYDCQVSLGKPGGVEIVDL